MRNLFPDATTDIAASMNGPAYDLDAAIQGKELEARMEQADLWFDRLMSVCMEVDTDSPAYDKATSLYAALGKSMELRAWEQVDAIVEALEREFR